MIIVLAVFFISLWLYLIFAGADFGAGILEIFKGKRYAKQQEMLITRAMGPVWEANHVWLVLSVVIFFVGFPKLFMEISIVLHIPLTAVLIGIIFRGSAFTFRHYDAIKDSSQKWYSFVFAWSSAWTTMWIGVIVGAVMMGKFSTHSTNFYDVYISPWFNSFSILVGIFLSAILAYITATFMVAETDTIDFEFQHEVKNLFKRRALGAIATAIPIGGLLILYGQIFHVYSLNHFFSNPLSILSFGISTLLLPAQYFVLKRDKLEWLKYLGVAQLSLIFIGLVINQFPYLIYNEQSQYFLNFYDGAAPASVMKQLMIALIIGSIVIFPPYIYLMKIFKYDSLEK